MSEKQKIAIRASGTDVDGTAATSSFTSDAIELPDGAWSLNVWFTSLSVSGNQPRITIEVSNDDDANSFNELENAVNVTVPRMVSKSDFEFKYLRIVYEPRGASAGSKYFDLIRV